jgi:hypothetical protein
MSSSALKLLAASGAKGDPVYVDDVFSTTLYKGDNSTQTVTTGIDVLGEGGLIWTCQRNNGGGFNLIDSGQGSSYSLDSASTNAPANNSTQLTFLNNGYRINGGSTAWDLNQNNLDYVAWSWQKQPGFLDIVTYTGDGATSRDISHNLETAPGVIIIKRTDGASDWAFQHVYNNNYVHYLNLTDYQSDSGATLSFNTSTFKVVGPSSGLAATKCTNVSGASYVAYLFANDSQDFGTDEDEAIIKCGSYTGNGSTDGPTIDLGFEPQWLLIKNASGSSYWYLFDIMRGIVNGGDSAVLFPNSTDAESSSSYLQVNPNGFKLTKSVAGTNSNTDTHIYMAIRRPHKPAEEFAATQLLGLDKPTSGNKITPGFPADFGFTHEAASSGAWYAGSRLTQGTSINFVDAPAESSHANYAWDSMTQFFTGYTWAGYMSYGFRRAPGFFDVVTYTGNQTARQIPHNLGVVPEMMWVKCRSQTRNWAVYLASQGNTKVAQLNGGDSFTADTSSWNNTSPTSTHFTVGDSATTNFNPEPMIAYLFASVPGISKIGTYTGTGTSSNVNVDCGFSSGVRFVLIKRADDVTAWYVWDSVRGIVSGTDPYLRLNQDNAEVTTTDWIDPLSSGFTVTNAAGNDINTSGGTYFFYAIA